MKTKGSPTEVDIELGQILRKNRKLKGLSQSMLAELVDVRFQQIGKYEIGTNRIAASRMIEIAEALQMPLASFWPEKYKLYDLQMAENIISQMQDKIERLEKRLDLITRAAKS